MQWSDNVDIAVRGRTSIYSLSFMHQATTLIDSSAQRLSLLLVSENMRLDEKARTSGSFFSTREAHAAATASCGVSQEALSPPESCDKIISDVDSRSTGCGKNDPTCFLFPKPKA
jgi:hypothetical protein